MRGSEDNAFLGEMLSPADGALPVESGVPWGSGKPPSKETNLLWEYRVKGTVCGFPVEDAARNLSVSSDEELMSALETRKREHVKVFWLSPESGVDEYEEILARCNDGTSILEERSLQYDQAKSAYMVFLRYSDVSYTVSDRYRQAMAGMGISGR